MIIKQSYELTELLAEDLLTFLYRGKHLITKKSLLIWKVKQEYLSADNVRALLTLSKKLITVMHPNILPLIDVEYDGENIFAIYDADRELRPLDVVLYHQNDVDVNERWTWVRAIFSALIELESRGLCHGNINLNTVWLSSDGTIFLVRSGIFIPLLKDHLTSFELVDECQFFAPESIQHRQYTNQSDMYSIGVIMYRLFSNAWPYREKEHIDSLKKEMLEGPTPFKTVHTRVPEKISDIITICMRHDPNHRFSSFTECVKAYRNNATSPYMIERSSNAIHDDIREDINKKSRNRRWRIILIIAAIIASVLGTFIGQSAVETYVTSIPDRDIPNVIGLPIDVAQERLRDVDLKSDIAGERPHATFEKGIVFESKPGPGRQVKKHRVIRLFVSSGMGKALVPDLTGRFIDDALNISKERRLSVNATEKIFSPNSPKGVVLSQVPTPNTFVSPSESIQVVISKGFPVDIEIGSAYSWFFGIKDRVKRVMISFSVLSGWDDQQVTITYSRNGRTDIIYNRLHRAIDHQSLDFELDNGGSLEIFYNDELAESRWIPSDSEEVK